MMMKGMRFSITVVALGAMLLALGGTAAWAQTTTEPASLVIVEQPPALGAVPSISQYQVVTPTPGTGSVVVVQPPVAGTGPSSPRYQLLIPGPNPAQNTAVSLGQQLSTARGSTVTVYTVPTF